MALAPRPLRVLVAEDNDTNRMLAIRLLSKMGHAVTAAGNGAVAVAEFARAAFDVVLMDMQMPVMDGPSAMRVIRGQERAPARIPIIALTADAMREHHLEYIEAGADLILTKPVDWSLLAAEMDRLTRGERAVSAEAAVPAVQGPAPVLDLALLAEMHEGLGAKLPALLDNMMNEAARYTDLLRESALRGETDAARRTAHSLKGLAAQFGAPRLASVAACAEHAAKRGENVGPFLAEIEALAGEALAALRVWRPDAAQRDKSATPVN
jgi:CheY-like chemotaxis protein